MKWITAKEAKKNLKDVRIRINSNAFYGKVLKIRFSEEAAIKVCGDRNNKRVVFAFDGDEERLYFRPATEEGFMLSLKGEYANIYELTYVGKLTTLMKATTGDYTMKKDSSSGLYYIDLNNKLIKGGKFNG